MTRADWRNRGHAAYWAFLVHRISGIALALFLPVHFLVLARALDGAAALDAFLAWTRAPGVIASEVVLVFALAAHLTGGLRLLFVEFVGWKSESQKALLAVAGGVAAFCAIAFALNVV
jgi:fumarate reductase subunit D